MKNCSKCKLPYPLTYFNKDSRRSDGYGSWCLSCKNDGVRFTRYGITREEYESLLKAQEGACAICHTIEPGGNVGQSGPQFAVDHDHETGKLRALLCRSCNIGLGNFGDDPERLLAAASYLLQFKDVAWAELL